jgi:DNA-binding SARP family transcriptional activator
MKHSGVSEDSAALQITLLGPPQTAWRGAALALPRRQVRALFFYLAEAPEPAPRDRLAFLFWPDLSDLAARQNLKRLLNTLRNSLPDGTLLLADHSVIELDRTRTWCDAAAFEQLAAASDPGSWTQAVDLYRGRFLDGFSLPDSPEYGDWQFQVQAQMERYYLAALSGLIDVRRAAGDLDAAIDYALRHMAVDELAEDVHRRLIELYAARGERSAAARQFERCVLVLERDLGVRPLPETRAAYEAAISARPPRPPAAPHWNLLPSLDLPLIGREDAVRTLADAYRRLQMGGLILVYGEPGVGKSRLMQEFARSTQATVLAGANPPGAQSLPYTALREALHQALSLPDRWQGIRPIWLAEAGRLLPEIGDLFPQLPMPVQVESGQAQARLFEALARCFLGQAAQGPLLLCLDDLQWADPATLSWLAALPRWLAGSRVCILASCRLADVTSVADVKRAFARPGLLAETLLSRLTTADISAVLAYTAQAPDAAQPLAARLHAATGGNAFFVLETVRVLLESGSLADPPDHLPLPSTVQAAIERRLQRLSPPARQALEAAAVLVPDLAFGLLAQTAGRSELEMAQGLDELERRQLLAGGDGRRFSHDLVREVVYDGLSPWRRRILHRRAAEALGAVRQSPAEQPWAAMAGHYARAGEGAEAVRCYEQAAQVAQRLLAHQEACDILVQALAIAGDLPAQAEAVARLHEMLGDSLMARGQHEAAEEAYTAALAQRAPQERMARAVLQRKVADALRTRMLVAEAETTLLQATATIGDPAADWPAAQRHAWLDIQLSLMSTWYLRGDFSRLAALADAIGPVVTADGAPGHRADYTSRLAELAVRREHFTLSSATVDLCRVSLATAQETGDLARIAWAQLGVGFSLLWAGDLANAEPALLAAFDRCEEAGVSHHRLLALVYLACCRRLRGDVEAARPVVAQSLEAAAEVDMPIYAGVAHAQQAWLHWRAGDHAAARAEAEQAATLWGDYPYPFRWLGHWVLLAVHSDRGALAEAVQQAQAILHPSQRCQPGELPAALEAAVRAWPQDVDAAGAALRRAIELAQSEGYL